MEMIQKPKAIIFGLGQIFTAYKNFIYSDFNVIGLMDNAAQTRSEIDGIPIYSVDMLPELEYDVICVTANYTNSYTIRRQLTGLGVSLSKLRFFGRTGTYPYRIPYDFFRTDLCEDDKKRLFSENIERVVLEINSQCNRRCWFCPNSIVDRHSKNIEMEDTLFEKVVDELASINYCYDILLSYFNEPMCSSKIYERIRDLRKALPKSYIYVFSNGDLISKDALVKLADAGCDLVAIDVYTDDLPGEYSQSKVLAGVDRLIHRLDLQMDSPRRARIKDMDVEIITQDFSATASNRAESLPGSLPIPKIETHPRPCIKNFISYHIAYNGKVYPCPNMHTEVEKHQQYCVGDLNTESIFDVYTGSLLNEFRKNNFFHRDTLPCRSCIWNFESFINNRYHRPFRDRPGGCV